ncbi:uncharacterized protein LOC110432601 [Sorghum bicolor]|uniref:uncharacterized protein LOC110432601 n=1 Tax=Sorghum bicolor TaxID=4558 RepID=UPI000B424FF7|nr:uncharacterized protein LOC110432601 [Sorghum bicolor]|eukprot:XP_021309036.1 uncharacterized protein LOC110432601 [Sorghum bicolor]
MATAAFDLNEEPPLEHDNGFDLNLPLDEFGAVDFDYLQNHADPAPVQPNQRRKDMSEEVRKQVYQTLLLRSKNGKLGKSDTKVVAAQFGVHLRQVQRLWKQGKTALANNIPVDVGSRKKGTVGRKPSMSTADLEVLRSIPYKERMTIEDVCAKLNMSKWAIQRYLKKGFLRRHSSSIKPYLTQANKKARLKWCVEMVKRDLLADPRFQHLDLGFFRAIQAIQYKKNEKSIEALVPTVQQAFIEYSAHKTNRIFVTLQSVYIEAMKVKGCNKFKIPH